MPNYEKNPELYEKCFKKALFLKENQYVYQSNEITLHELTDLLFLLEEERNYKSQLSDMNIDYNDQIISIEEMGELSTIDITVTGDNLFYCNDILTKNSIGLPQTVDMLFALIGNEELDALNQQIIKQLKNRYNDLNYYKRFVIGLDKSKMKYYDVEASAQVGLSDAGQAKDIPAFDKGSFGSGMKAESDYSGFKF